MSWTNICVEGFCFGGSDEQDNYPCGRNCPSYLCLENGHCPHFAYSETTERDVSNFPPLRLILYDRIKIWVDDIYWKLRWWFWDRLSFNRRKTKAFFDSIPVVSSEDFPVLSEWEDEKKENNLAFKEWFDKVNKDEQV